MRTSMILLALLAFAGCNSGNGGKAKPSVLDSLKIEKQLGPLEERTYEGLLPAADGPGIEYVLRLWNQKYSGGGVYELTMNYLEANDGKDHAFTQTGRWITLRGDAADNDATVYQLSPGDSLKQMNFLWEGKTVTLLNDRFEKAASELNYTLRLQ